MLLGGYPRSSPPPPPLYESLGCYIQTGYYYSVSTVIHLSPTWTSLCLSLSWFVFISFLSVLSLPSDRLDFVMVVFLPANATFLIQPCDAGVIKAFKFVYRRHMLHKVTQLVDDPSVPVVDTPVLKKHINMLHCLQFSRAAWDSLTRHNQKLLA